jgi:hypothetical protein
MGGGLASRQMMHVSGSTHARKDAVVAALNSALVSVLSSLQIGDVRCCRLSQEGQRWSLFLSQHGAAFRDKGCKKCASRRVPRGPFKIGGFEKVFKNEGDLLYALRRRN